ncbi:MAG: C4-type zinc ribbon domain-containing protein [Dehalococcoidia bacterium]|nr:C4-type zinc ribbon domain-containing protein [Dehalococcoidia bacterium]
MTVAEQLYQLQEIDLALDREKAALVAVEARMGETEALRAARQALATAKEEQTRLQREQRSVEADIQDADEKVRTLDKKLYGGSVKSPKELMNMEEELERLKAKRSGTDGKLLALMDTVEQAQGAVKSRAAEMEAAEHARRVEQDGLRTEQARLQTEIAGLTSRRKAAAAQPPAPALALYERVRPLRQGLAVARIASRMCMGCRISLPESDYRRAARGDEIVQCPNCQRILFTG